MILRNTTLTSNKKINKIIPIIYNGGAYGTYLEWLLTTLTTDQPIIEPFAKGGSSHNYLGNPLRNIEGWNKFINHIDLSVQFVRLHPKTLESESISGTIKTVLDSVEHCIYLYPDCNSVLLNINNYFSKIWSNSWVWSINNVVGRDKIYENWPVDPTTPIDQIPIWIQREFLSYFLMPAWYDQVEWYHPDTLKNDRCITILIDQLLDDVEGTLHRIQKCTGLIWSKSINDILPMHQKMLSLQTYRNQDQLCKDIIESVTLKNVISIDWSNFELPLASQSYIQWQLRNLGFEIECHGLDIFPTNSIQLKSILYSNQKI